MQAGTTRPCRVAVMEKGHALVLGEEPSPGKKRLHLDNNGPVVGPIFMHERLSSQMGKVLGGVGVPVLWCECLGEAKTRNGGEKLRGWFDWGLLGEL